MGKPSSRSESSSSTKADKKFEKKLQFYASKSEVRDTVTALTAQKAITKKKKLRSRQKKLKAYDLSSLSEFLPEMKASQQMTIAGFKLNCKSRQKLILKEGKQLSTVFKHPAFQLDPLAAICQHLESTQPVVDEKPKKTKTKNGGKKKNEKKSKGLAGPQSMEI